MMLVVGLTGGIAMGKSFIANVLEAKHIPIFDADKIVAKILAENAKIAGELAKKFPGCIVANKVIKKLLAEEVLYNKKKLQILEQMLHPLIIHELNRFIKTHLYRRSKIILLDIPLLFEIKLDKICNVVILASAAKFLQRKRAMSRKTISEIKLKTIISNQMANHKKILKADKIIYTGKSKADVSKQVRLIFKSK